MAVGVMGLLCQKRVRVSIRSRLRPRLEDLPGDRICSQFHLERLTGTSVLTTADASDSEQREAADGHPWPA
jgi:hypothetical protein